MTQQQMAHDPDARRGTIRALQASFDGLPDEPVIHVAAAAAATEFEALLEQLENPPPQYRRLPCSKV